MTPRYRLAAAGAALAVLCAGCGAGSTAAEAGSDTILDSTPGTAQSTTQDGVPGGSTPAAAGKPGSRFASRTVTARLTGYDAGLKTVEFHLVHWVSGGPNNGVYEVDPADPAAHRLPLAAAPTILSIISICSNGLTSDGRGHATQPCTVDQLTTTLAGGTTAYAEVQVNPQAQINRISELYYP